MNIKANNGIFQIKSIRDMNRMKGGGDHEYI